MKIEKGKETTKKKRGRWDTPENIKILTDNYEEIVLYLYQKKKEKLRLGKVKKKPPSKKKEKK